jgi:uncharacterized protein (DUF433 family)
MSAPVQIVINPQVCGGRPIIAGTRMRVSDILDMLAEGVAVDEIIADFPYVSRDQVKACLQYAARAFDHPVVLAAE